MAKKEPIRSVGIYGASDDLATIEINGEAFDEQGESEDYAFVAEDKSLHVHIQHSGRGGWKITTRIEDESEEGQLPFDVAIMQHNHSPKLVVTARDVPVQFLYYLTEDEDEGRVAKTMTIRPAAECMSVERKGEQ